MNNILETIHTARERDMLVFELSALKDSLYHVDAKKLENVRKTMRMKTIESLEKGFQEQQISWDQTNAVSTALSSLVEKLNRIQSMTVCIAFEPTEETLSLIHSWALTALKEPVLVDVQIDPSILAGATIVYEGLYRSWTLSDQIELYFKKQAVKMIATNLK